MNATGIHRVVYDTPRSPKSLLGKLELVALFVGIEGMHYDPQDQNWTFVTGDGRVYHGDFDEVIKNASVQVIHQHPAANTVENK